MSIKSATFIKVFIVIITCWLTYFTIFKDIWIEFKHIYSVELYYKLEEMSDHQAGFGAPTVNNSEVISVFIVITH